MNALSLLPRAFIGALAVLAIAVHCSPAVASDPQLISRADGSRGERIGAASVGSISGDGRYVAFAAKGRIFVRDVVAGRTRGQGEGEEPDLSADGHHLAYVDADGQIYVRDLRGGGRVLVSRQAYGDSIPGPKGDAGSRSPSLSADGRFVAFASYSLNLVDEDGRPGRDRYPSGVPFGQIEQVFVRDLVAKRTTLVSRASGRAGRILAVGSEREPVISADGRFVAFRGGGVYLRDLRSHRTRWLGDGYAPALSATGRRVAYLEEDAVVVRDLETDWRQRVRVSGTPSAIAPALSADGRFLAVESESARLYLRDLLRGRSLLVRYTGNAGTPPSLSTDGRFLAFDTLRRVSSSCSWPSDVVEPPAPEYEPAEANASLSCAGLLTGGVYRATNPLLRRSQPARAAPTS
ncbi:MAG: hypothetical protein WA687_06740 [Solirubrobacterales bacterium]